MELGVITEKGKATEAPESRSMKKPADLGSLGETEVIEQHLNIFCLLTISIANVISMLE